MNLRKMLDSINFPGNKEQTPRRYHLTTVRMVIDKKLTSVSEDVG